MNRSVKLILNIIQTLTKNKVAGKLEIPELC